MHLSGPHPPVWFLVFSLVLWCRSFRLKPSLGSFPVPKIIPFSLQPGRRLFAKPVRDISEVSWTQVLFRSGVVTPRAQPPTWRTRISLFVSVITFDLSGLDDSASSYATAGLTLRTIWPHKPHHYVKVGTPSGGPWPSIPSIFTTVTGLPNSLPNGPHSSLVSPVLHFVCCYFIFISCYFI